MTRILWAGGALLCLASLSLYGFGMNNPAPMRWAALAALVSAAAVIWTWRGAPVRVSRTALAGLAFLIYAAASLLWSPDWREGVVSLYTLVLLAGLFLIVQHADRERLGLVAPLVATAAILISVVGEGMYPGTFGLTGNENFQSELLVMLIPVAFHGVVAWLEKTLGALCFMAVCVGIVALCFNESHAKWAGLAGLGAGSVLVMARHGFWRASAVCVIAGLAVLWFKAGSASQSIMQRLELGYNTLAMWADRPFFGTGLGGFNYLYPAYQEAHVGLIPSHTLYGVTLYAGAAHNEYLQALATFGLFGSGLFALFVITALVDRRTDLPVTGALFVLFILSGLSLVNFPLQNPATAVIGVVALATVASPDRTVSFAQAAVFVRRVLSFTAARRNGFGFGARRAPHDPGSGVARH